MKRNVPFNDESRWQAVLDRNKQADGLFVFAVLTTGIFCRPSCRARHALRQNVRFYPDASAAQAAGFRPCKRCQPDVAHPWQQKIDKVIHACRLLEQDHSITLDELAREVAVSPWHFHRLFKSVTGLTPKNWQQAWRERKFREAPAEGQTITAALYDAGFPASSSFYRHASEILGMPARKYRRGGNDMHLKFTLGNCSLGRCLVATSEQGVCAVLLGETDNDLLRELAAVFPHAHCSKGDKRFCAQTERVINMLDGQPFAGQLPLDIRGTAFQQQIWRALRQIPSGETRSYQQIAQAIGKPNAARAVASACAANKLALIIPCHRVVRCSGALSGYRWGEARKAELLRREALNEKAS